MIHANWISISCNDVKKIYFVANALQWNPCIPMGECNVKNVLWNEETEALCFVYYSS